MDPLSSIIPEVWKATGLLGTLFLLTGWSLMRLYKDMRYDKRELIKALANCQESHVAIARESTAAIVNNNAALKRVAIAVDRQYDRNGRDDDNTPPHGNHHTPRPH